MATVSSELDVFYEHMDVDSEENIAVSSITCSRSTEKQREFVLQLLSMYKDCPELWNTQTNTYTDKIKRSTAMTKITNRLKKYDKNFTEEKLRQKINTLRSNFNRERTKMRKSLEDGEVYEPRLWYYNEMLFITTSTQRSRTNNAVKKTAVKIENPPTHTHTTSTVEIHKKPKKSHNDELLSLAADYFRKPKNDTEVITKSWALKFNRLAPDQRLFAEKIINDVLFEGEMGTLTRDGVIFASATSNALQHI